MLKSIIKNLLKAGLNFVLPHTCLICKNTVIDYGLCGDCFKNIKPITEPRCVCCGFPLLNRSGGKKCGGCLKAEPILKIRSAIYYTNDSKQIILYLKHADGHEVAPFMARAMVRSIDDIKDSIDIIIPVPLHKRRLLKRRFNQSADLARAIKQSIPVPLLENILLRTKDTESQGNKSFRKRFNNLKNAFHITENQKIKGKTILLVDDVYTSGATLHNCANTLLKAGVKQVIGVTYGRVVKPHKAK